MKAILVDDEPDGIRTLKKLLELNCPEVEIVATCSSAADATSKMTGRTEAGLCFSGRRCREKTDWTCWQKSLKMILK